MSSTPLQLLFLDVWGLAPLFSINKFYFCIVDDLTKYIWLFPITHKFEVFAIFFQFKNLVETYFGRKIQAVQIYNGGDFHPLQSTLPSMGITHGSSCPHTHCQMVLLSAIIDTLVKLDSLSLPWLTPP
jgi:hypothetical protein